MSTGNTTYPKSAGNLIHAGADLVLTIDYVPTPVAADDPWSMGLFISRTPPKRRLERKQASRRP